MKFGKHVTRISRSVSPQHSFQLWSFLSHLIIQIFFEDEEFTVSILIDNHTNRIHFIFVYYDETLRKNFFQSILTRCLGWTVRQQRISHFIRFHALPLSYRFTSSRMPNVVSGFQIAGVNSSPNVARLPLKLCVYSLNRIDNEPYSSLFMTGISDLVEYFF